METPPTYIQWTDICIKDARKGKASAMTGLTYNMVKMWPDCALKRAYDLLLQMWNAEHTPAFHKLRWMCLIPKLPGSNKQADTRPISLLEVLRKLWNSFFMKKVNNFLSRHNVPHTAQCAYWAKMGTDTASLELVNAMEAVRTVEGILHNDLKQQMFKEMLAKVRMHTTYMKKSRHSIDAVLAACNMSIQSTVLYRATLSSWTTEQVDELDGVLQTLYRKIYNMMPGHPSELIQLPNELGGLGASLPHGNLNSHFHSWGGLGCQSLRKKMVENKWAIVHRNETLCR